MIKFPAAVSTVVASVIYVKIVYFLSRLLFCKYTEEARGAKRLYVKIVYFLSRLLFCKYTEEARGAKRLY